MPIRALPLYIELAKPCHIDWDSMPGDESTRHCAHCQRSVVNFSELSRDEIHEVMARGACVTFEYRVDGSIVTRSSSGTDRHRASRGSVALAAALATALGCSVGDPNSHSAAGAPSISVPHAAATSSEPAPGASPSEHAPSSVASAKAPTLCRKPTRRHPRMVGVLDPFLAPEWAR